MMDRRNGDHPYGTRWLTVRGPSIDIAFTDLRDSIRAKDLFDSVQSIHLVEYLEPRDGPTVLYALMLSTPLSKLKRSRTGHSWR